MPGACSFCHADKAPLLCRRCHGASYCSAACQRQHWRAHKPECRGCAICHADLGTSSRVATTICNHTFHRSCLQQLLRSSDNPLDPDAVRCPLCRASLLCWVPDHEVPCSFHVETLVRLIVGVVDEAIERYQLVLLTDARARAWLTTLTRYAPLEAAMSRPAYATSNISQTRSQVICSPTAVPARWPCSDKHYYLATLLSPDQVANIAAARWARQPGDSVHVVVAKRRYWLVLASAVGNKLAQLVRAKVSCGVLRTGSPPELALPPTRTAHWAYTPRASVPWEASVRWVQASATEATRATLNAQLLAYCPALAEQHA